MNLFTWVESDREALERAGLEWADVESLPARVGALSQAESRWLARRFSQEEAEQGWLAAEPAAFELRNDLVAAMRHAYRESPDLLGRVAEIGEGASNADMIQDLNDIAVFGLANLAPLKHIGVPGEALEAAAARADELTLLLAAREADTTDEDALLLRNRAFAYLKETVDEIRACGRFAFRKDPERRRGYLSGYRRSHRRSGGADDKEDESIEAAGLSEDTPTQEV